MNRAFYIYKKNPEFSYGRTGFYDKETKVFVFDGGETIECPRNHVWFFEDGYANLR